jgi:hypothetical protein
MAVYFCSFWAGIEASEFRPDPCGLGGKNLGSLDKLNATLPDLMQLRGKRAVESVEKDRRLSHPSHSKATTNCGKRGKIRDFPTLTTVNEGNGASRISTLYFTGSHPKR